MSILKMTLMLAVLTTGVMSQAAELTVAARQRYPWNGFVDVDCSMQIPGLGENRSSLKFSVKDNETGEDLDVRTLTLNGESFMNGVSTVTNGNYRFVWNAAADVGADYVATNISLSVKNVSPPAYLAIDLKDGASATSYPILHLSDVPSEGWTDEYKTRYLVMRLIPAGIFTMGSPSDELGRVEGETQHTVTLTQAFYMGAFEITRSQYARVMGGDLANLSEGDWTRPVEAVSWDAVNATNGFIARMTAKTGLASFSLPTEAQWEYACRAGTTTALNSGKNLTVTDSSCTNMAEVGRYFYNQDDGMGGSPESGYVVAVGSYLPNDWGLYDMHGNVYEWCLDWWVDDLGTMSATDPTGAVSGTDRVVRGGNCSSHASYCRSAARDGLVPSRDDVGVGFRLALSPKILGAGVTVGGGTECSMTTALKLDLRMGPRETAGIEALIFSNLWSGNSNATVRLAVNGTVLLDNQRGEGVYDWRGQILGTYDFTHTTILNGVEGETLTASFNYVGDESPSSPPPLQPSAPEPPNSEEPGTMPSDRPTLDLQAYEFSQYKDLALNEVYEVHNLRGGSSSRVTLKKIGKGKLPSGVKLKYDKKTGAVVLSGAPAKVGTFEYVFRIDEKVGRETFEGVETTLRFTVRDMSRLPQSAPDHNPAVGKKIKVDIPAWTKEGAFVALLNVSVSTKSKISAKIKGVSSKTLSFKGGWQKVEKGELSAILTAKSGEVLMLILKEDGNICAHLSKITGPYGSELTSTEWGVAAVATDFSKYEGERVVTTAEGQELTLKISKKGKVSYKSTTNKSVKGSVQLILNAYEDGAAQVCMVKQSKKLSYAYILKLD